MTDIQNEQQAMILREQLAAYERNKAEAAFMARTQLYQALQPILQNVDLSQLLRDLQAVIAQHPDDGFIGSYVNQLAIVIPNLLDTLEQFQAGEVPEDPQVPTEAPEGAMEGQDSPAATQQRATG